MTEHGYIRALLDAKGIGLNVALQLMQHFGSAAAIFDNRTSLPKQVADRLVVTDDTMRRIDQEEAFCDKNHIAILTYNDAAYPQRLRECADAPLALYYRGNADLNARHIISVVGTRRITERGKDIVAQFCRDIAQLVPDALIVSGLAYGVDIHAHRAALQNGLSTVAVLAHGLDRIYPNYHRQTAVDMLSQGGLLTEFTSGTTPFAGNFVSRNRIVAGLCETTVVVESAEKGGALITAHLAQEYNRDVFAFPGRINDEFSAGCNKIIRKNVAALITKAADMTEALNWSTTPQTQHIIQPEIFPDLSAEESKLVDALTGVEQKSIIELTQDTQLPFHKTMQLLLELELKGMIKGLPGGIYRLLR